MEQLEFPYVSPFRIIEIRRDSQLFHRLDTHFEQHCYNCRSICSTLYDFEVLIDGEAYIYKDWCVYCMTYKTNRIITLMDD